MDRSPGNTLAGKRFGRYELVTLLGRGGMGEVYAARHVDLGTQAAVKIIYGAVAADPTAADRVLREGRATAAIRHPNVVSVLDVGTEQGTPYLVMELLESDNLAHRLECEGPCGPEEASDLLLPIFAGVAAAHDAGVVHRDLKPSNVLLARRRDSLEPVVVDFGLSAWVDGVPDPRSTSSVVAGTPRYMAPERLRGTHRADPRCDQYSLGVLAYECLTGGTPFWSEDRYELIHSIMTADVVAPSTLNPQVPPELDAIVLRAMARDPEARFPTVRSLGALLLAFASVQVRQRYRPEFASSTESAASFPGTIAPRAVLGGRRPWVTAAAGATLVMVALTSAARWEERRESRSRAQPGSSADEKTRRGEPVRTPPENERSTRSTRDDKAIATSSGGPDPVQLQPPATDPPTTPRRATAASVVSASNPMRISPPSERGTATRTDPPIERGTANIPIIE
jgi:eukaryotic-like serine/threonine-protein kinase